MASDILTDPIDEVLLGLLGLADTTGSIDWTALPLRVD